MTCYCPVCPKSHWNPWNPTDITDEITEEKAIELHNRMFHNGCDYARLL